MTNERDARTAVLFGCGAVVFSRTFFRTLPSRTYRDWLVTFASKARPIVGSEKRSTIQMRSTAQQQTFLIDTA
jgi:hypothetical protein